MSKTVILELKGNLEQQGFYATLHIAQAGSVLDTALDGYLPPSSKLLNHLKQWQIDYRRLSTPMRSLRPYKLKFDGKIDPLDICIESAQQLAQQFKLWLRSDSFRDVELQLRQALMPTDDIQVLIRTSSTEIQALPWHLWDFIEHYPKAEIALSGSHTYSQSNKDKTASAGHQVSILAVLGDRQNIDTESDQQSLNQLPGAYIEFLVEPTHQHLADKLYEQSWNILFFAGHSETQLEGQGILRLNSTTHLSINEIKYAIKRAINNGLQLAIFNSCDGLGLAHALVELQLPHMIVMREAVPDPVAQKFLKHFLEALAHGQTLHLAEREARERLQGMETDYPCASWLPVIYQQPTATPIVWQNSGVSESRVIQLQSTGSIQNVTAVSQESVPNHSHRNRFYGLVYQYLRLAGLTSFLVTALILGIRELGFLESWELQSYDQLLRLRPPETTDSRILIVEADEEDIYQYGHPLPDTVLADAIQELNKYNPLAIGLDIYRDRLVPPGEQRLLDEFQSNPNLITACAFGSDEMDPIAQPSASPMENVGFVDLENDASDYHVRRVLLSRYPAELNSKCITPYSFGLQLLFTYLETSNSQITETLTSDYDWQFGNITFKRLSSRSGGYHRLDARGNQILINYRATDNIAQRVTLNDLLNNQVQPDWIKNRVVLIGVTAPSIQDYHLTPYGRMRGLDIQAHSFSQLISAIENNRPLIQWMSIWGEALWILMWCILGSILIITIKLYSFHERRQILLLIIIISSSVGMLYLVCWLALLSGWWLPLIPNLMGMTVAEIILYRKLDFWYQANLNKLN